MFSVSITHNSKIRELSDGNKKLETEFDASKQTSRYESHHFWVMSYGNGVMSYEIGIQWTVKNKVQGFWGPTEVELWWRNNYFNKLLI